MPDGTHRARTGRRAGIVPALAGAIISTVVLAGCTSDGQPNSSSPTSTPSPPADRDAG